MCPPKNLCASQTHYSGARLAATTGTILFEPPAPHEALISGYSLFGIGKALLYVLFEPPTPYVALISSIFGIGKSLMCKMSKRFVCAKTKTSNFTQFPNFRINFVFPISFKTRTLI